MIYAGEEYIPWFKWKKRLEKKEKSDRAGHFRHGIVLTQVFPIELLRLQKQKCITDHEFVRLKQMITSSDEEDHVVAEKLLLTLRKKRLKK